MALFRFADKLSRHPADVEKSDADELRKHGWNDEAMLETTLAVSLYACANRSLSVILYTGAVLVAATTLLVEVGSIRSR